MAEQRKYFIKSNWIFNLEAMDDKLWCLQNDLERGIIATPIYILGYTINAPEDVYSLMEECRELEWVAKTRKVTSKEYGRIKRIAEWRIEQRYFTCLANGMDETSASVYFEDL